LSRRFRRASAIRRVAVRLPRSDHARSVRRVLRCCCQVRGRAAATRQLLRASAGPRRAKATRSLQCRFDCLQTEWCRGPRTPFRAWMRRCHTPSRTSQKTSARRRMNLRGLPILHGIACASCNRTGHPRHVDRVSSLTQRDRPCRENLTASTTSRALQNRFARFFGLCAAESGAMQTTHPLPTRPFNGPGPRSCWCTGARGR